MKSLLYIITLTAFFSSCSILGDVTSNVDRSKAPEPGPAPTLNLGSYSEFTLDNGLKVIVVENNKLPRVSYSINLNIPPLLEGDKAGYVTMAGDLMEAGTPSRSKSEIAEEIDFIGANLSTSSTSVRGSSLKKHSESLLTVMSDVLMNPTFPEEELEKEKLRTISGLASEKSDPNSIASRITSSTNYGTDHPYGEQLTEETIDKIQRQDLVDYYATWFKPNIATLIIVGDIDETSAKTQAENYFGAWKKESVPQTNIQKPVSPESNRVIFVPLENAVQSIIHVTYPIDFNINNEDYLAAKVMNNILGGGGFYSRLIQNIREDKGFTYGAGSQLGSDEFIGYFDASASVRNEVTDSAVTEFMYELERIVSEAVNEETLQLVKNNMNGRFALSLERPTTVASFAYNKAKYNLPEDYYDTYLDRLSKITVEDVMNAAKNYIHPKNANIVVVGNREEVSESLAKFSASGEVEFFDMYGNPWMDRRPAPDGVSVDMIFKNYINAIGGEEKLSSISQYTQSNTMSMMGQSMPMIVKTKGDDKMMFVIEMGGMIMSKQVLNGDAGQIEQMGQKSPMDDLTIQDAKMQADLLSPLHYEQYGLTADILGVESVEGEDAYVVALNRGEENAMIEFYSVSTGLKLMTTVTINTPNGPMSTVSTNKEYSEFGGVKFPSKTEVSQMGQTYIIEVQSMDFDTPISDDEFKIN